MSFFLVETFGIKIDQNTCNSPNFDQIQRCKDSKPKKRKKIKKMADKERTATAAFLPRGLGKGGAKGRHSSAQSQVGCNPENPFFSFTASHCCVIGAISHLDRNGPIYGAPPSGWLDRETIGGIVHHARD